MTSETVVEMQLSELLELFGATGNDAKGELRLAYNPERFQFVNVKGTYSAAGELISVQYGVYDIHHKTTNTHSRPPEYFIRVNIPEPVVPSTETETPMYVLRALVVAAIRPDRKAPALDEPQVDGWAAKVEVEMPGVSIRKERFFITEDEAEEFAATEGHKYDLLYNYPDRETPWEAIYSNADDFDESA